VGVSQPLGEPTATLWSDRGKELKEEKKSREKAEMCCIQTTAGHTSSPVVANSGLWPLEAGPNTRMGSS